jgi:hypothetical protein
MFQRVLGFSDDEAARFASNPYVLSIFDELRQLVADLQAHADAQAVGLASARQSTQNKTAVREELIRVVTAMSRTARSIPGQAENFRFDQYHNDQELLTAARTFAARALPVKAEFTKRGMRIDFLEVLQADANALEQALSTRAERTRTHVSATATIDDLIDAGLGRVRELDTIVRNTFEDKPGKLAAWISASHVERAPHRAKPSPTPAPQA